MVCCLLSNSNEEKKMSRSCSNTFAFGCWVIIQQFPIFQKSSLHRLVRIYALIIHPLLKYLKTHKQFFYFKNIRWFLILFISSYFCLLSYSFKDILCHSYLYLSTVYWSIVFMYIFIASKESINLISWILIFTHSL